MFFLFIEKDIFKLFYISIKIMCFPNNFKVIYILYMHLEKLVYKIYKNSKDWPEFH